jgi:hypothetical protein
LISPELQQVCSGWPGRFELLVFQETKTAGPARGLANNDPANADSRFHGACIALSSGPVKLDCVTLVTDFPDVAGKLQKTSLFPSLRHAFVQIESA